MTDWWTKAKIWTKLILLGLAVLFLLVFSYENYSRSVDVWLIHVHTMTVLELLIATFLIGVVTTILARPIYRTLGQISQLKTKEVIVEVTKIQEIPATPAPPPPLAEKP